MIEKIIEEIAIRDTTDGTVKVFSGKEVIQIVQEVAKEYGKDTNVRSNADRIRNMSDEELNTFLWWFKISEMALFMQNTEEKPMNAVEQLNFLKSNEEIAFRSRRSTGKDGR